MQGPIREAARTAGRGEPEGRSLATPLAAAAGLGVGFIAGRLLGGRSREDHAA
jgi:hypothetical protein